MDRKGFIKAAGLAMVGGGMLIPDMAARAAVADNLETQSQGSVVSHVGMIIHSTTLDTEDKVKAIYGGETWIQHTNYVLRGASSGVLANSAAKTGGNDNAVVVSHSHPITYYLSTTVGGYDGRGVIGGPNYGEKLQYTAFNTTAAVGEDGTNKNIPNYKSVYIWERTA